jgi:mRNA interferase YafQ
MLQPVYRKKFTKDYKRIQKRGKDLKKLKDVVNTLAQERPLSKKLFDHALKGSLAGCRECHIEPDWLLIYTIKNPHIIFMRTGSHADLFR